MTGPPVDRLTALDRLMLSAGRRWPQEIGALALLDGTSLFDPAGELRVDAIREAMASRLDLVPRLRQVVQTSRGGPRWTDAPRFDLAEHVVVRPLPYGTVEAGLPAVAERLYGERLDPARPLWRIWLLPGLPDRRVAMIVRLHHVIADGVAAMMTVTALLGGPLPADRDPRAHDDPGQRHAGRNGRAWPAIRELIAARPGPRTSLDRTVGDGRRLAVIRHSLDEIRAIAHAAGATVNDVLLAVTAGGLRAVLRERGELAGAAVVPAYVPISLRPPGGGPPQGNAIAQMVVPLPVGEPDPGVALRRIAAATAERKARPHTSLDTLVRGGPLGRLILAAVMRQRVNVATACIRGPATPLCLCGAPVLDAVPMLPLIANEPLAVGGLSYAGRFTIGVVADRDAYPDLEVFVAGASAQLDRLGSSARRAPA
ncbi:WS/DGAT domain-containing protein [Actinoplanes sp. KI2]|uniref:wax ester/triacylglycerol synthase domain-containing protein n=1 Tax=Actinoplanes sp. KI2 TaxID=2983315 RepID=UPI0021D5B8FF|nr:wax ester/triacylglycerol synthase domain-containing protein [Actinoplanes sp. KI2]MCU7730497.1 WS/DGAT domain-containing protein [Actinoplanes sp. KI2]